MSITPTYPGVYIQELPSTSHTILAAPTSITAFVGYTHPLKTPPPTAEPAPPAPAIPLYSFADYQKNFGGFFDSPWLPDYVGQAVYQFFLNGGASAYVVGLTNPSYPVATASIPTTPDPIVFTATEPIAAPGPPATGIPMQIVISNLQQTTDPDDTANIVISYGQQVETYRKVLISTLISNPTSLEPSPTPSSSRWPLPPRPRRHIPAPGRRSASSTAPCRRREPASSTSTRSARCSPKTTPWTR